MTAHSRLDVLVLPAASGPELLERWRLGLSGAELSV